MILFNTWYYISIRVLLSQSVILLPLRRIKIPQNAQKFMAYAPFKDRSIVLKMF